MGKWISVDLPDGKMDAYLAVPEGGSGPGIVMLQEIFGVNEAMRAKAEKFAAAGFTVLVPDIFWRMEKRVDLGYSEDERTKAFGFMQKLDFPKALQDIQVAYQYLADQTSKDKKPSLVGYCLGGKLAVLAGSIIGDVTAIISFYGVKLDENITQIKSMSCPVSIHVGDDDAHIPMETVNVLRSELEGENHVNIEVYPGAKHGFFNELRSDVFDEDASAKAWDQVISTLSK